MLTSKLFETPDPAKTLNIQVGAASPLWGLFAGAAGAGLAYYWWLSRWREATHLEALLPAPAAALPEPTPAPEPVIEAAPLAELAVEAEAAPPMDAVIAPEPEAAAEPTTSTAVVEPLPEPVIEAAPAPVVEPEITATPAAPKKTRAKAAPEA